MDDEEQPAIRASALGILNCLCMLAEEAITVGLVRSAEAIVAAFDACCAERKALACDGAAPRDPLTLAPLH
jgi:hypothetical protein